MNSQRASSPHGLTRTALCGLLLCLHVGSLHADPKRLSLMPDPRGEFIRLCAPFMISRYAHPEAVCDCVRNALFDQIEDGEMLDAFLYGITERGVPTVNRSWVQPDKWPMVESVLTAIAEPTLDCMFGGKIAERMAEQVPLDGAALMPPVQGLAP